SRPAVVPPSMKEDEDGPLSVQARCPNIQNEAVLGGTLSSCDEFGRRAKWIRARRGERRHRLGVVVSKRSSLPQAGPWIWRPGSLEPSRATDGGPIRDSLERHDVVDARSGDLS